MRAKFFIVAVLLFLGMRDFDAIDQVGATKIPSILIEAGDNGGIVPHSEQEDFAIKHPMLDGWYRILNVGHDLPVTVGKSLGKLITDLIENPVKPRVKKKRIDVSAGAL